MVHGMNLLEFLINPSLWKFLVDMWCFRKKLLNLFPVNWCPRRNGEVWVCNRARAGFTTWSMIQVPVNSWVTVYSNCCCKGIWVFLTISLCIKDFNWKIKMPLTLMFFLIYHVYYTMFLFLNLYMLYILYLYAIFLNMFVHCFNIELQDVDELHFCLQVKSFMNDLENSNH